MALVLSPSSGSQRQADLYFKASLVYIASSRPARATHSDSLSQNKTKLKTNPHAALIKILSPELCLPASLLGAKQYLFDDQCQENTGAVVAMCPQYSYHQQQLPYKEQNVPASWACSLNDRKQSKGLAASL